MSWWVSVWVSEWVSKCVYERVSVWVSECVNVWLCGWLSVPQRHSSLWYPAASWYQHQLSTCSACHSRQNQSCPVSPLCWVCQSETSWWPSHELSHGLLQPTSTSASWTERKWLSPQVSEWVSKQASGLVSRRTLRGSSVGAQWWIQGGRYESKQCIQQLWTCSVSWYNRQ